MTNEDWKEVDKKLHSFYNTVKLKCDGYEVSLVLERLNQFKNAIVVYINGAIKGEWLYCECEESRRFFRKVTRSVLSPKEKKAISKISKKLQKELGLNNEYSFYCTYWTSFSSLKKQLIKQNSSIEHIM
ncbi:MAG: hypothetical protein Q8920_04395 [Bacillota bacterium]|nr:hypothetical protein [Bacillota bacterium]